MLAIANHVGDCQQQQSQHQEQSASVDVSSTGDVDINIDASQSQSQSQSQNCDGNTPPPAPTPTPPPPAPPPPPPTPVPPPPSQCPDQHQEQSLSTTTENAVEINQVQSQTNNCPAPANALPVWKGPTHATTTLGTLMTFNASATDPDGDTLTFATELPSGATWAASTGVFSWTPTATTSLGTTTAVRRTGLQYSWTSTLQRGQRLRLTMNTMPTAKIRIMIRSRFALRLTRQEWASRHQRDSYPGHPPRNRRLRRPTTLQPALQTEKALRLPVIKYW